MRKRILITGSRGWTHRESIRDAILLVLARHPDIPAGEWTLVHGAAAGADTIAGEEATALGLQVEVHPADWEQYGKRAGFIRNSLMVGLGADVLLAFVLDQSRGATMTVNLARKTGIETLVWESHTAQS